MTIMFLLTLFEVAVQSVIFAAVVMAVLFLSGRRLQPKWRYLLCLLVLVRLALPVLPNSPFSILPRVQQRFVSAAMTGETNPQIETAMQKTPQNTGQNAAHASAYTPPQDMATRSGHFTPANNSLDGLPNKHPKTQHVSMSRNVAGTNAENPAAASSTIDDHTNGDNIRTRLIMGTFLIWLCGAIFFALKYASGMIWLLRNQKHWPIADDGEMSVLLDECRHEIGVRRNVRCRYANDFAVAASFGILRPVILLPETTFRALPRSQKRLLLLHELTHIRRFDTAVQLFAILLTVIHWANPVLWFVRRRLENERESACDAAVLHKLEREDHRAYGMMVLAFAEAHVRKHTTAAMVGISHHRGLKRRIEMIIKHQPDTWRQPVLGLSLLIVLTLTGLTGAKQTVENPDVPESVVTRETVDITEVAAKAEPATRQEEIDIFDVGDRVIVRGQVMNEDKTPAANARVWQIGRQDEPITTDENGYFRVEISKIEIGRISPIHSFLALSNDGDTFGMGDVATVEAKSLGYSKSPGHIITLGRHYHVITGSVVDPEGKPVAGATVGGKSLYFQYSFPTRTNEDGTFRFLYPRHLPLRYVYAVKKGLGMMYATTNDPPKDLKNNDVEYLPPGTETSEVERTEFHLKLHPFGSRTICIVNEEEEPLADCRISPWLIRSYESEHDFDVLNCAFDFSVIPDQNGIAILDTIPKGWKPYTLDDILIHASVEGNVSPKDGKRYYYSNFFGMTVRGDSGPWHSVNRDQEKDIWTAKLAKQSRFEIKVRLPDGSPAAWEQFRLEFQTSLAGGNLHCILDSEGRSTFFFPLLLKEYEEKYAEYFTEMRRANHISFQAKNEHGLISSPVYDFDLGDGSEVKEFEFHMQPGVKISGMVHYDDPDDVPCSVYVFAKASDKKIETQIRRNFDVDLRTGRFEGELLPGEYDLEVQVHYYNPKTVGLVQSPSPQQRLLTTKRITVVEGQSQLELDLTPQ